MRVQDLETGWTHLEKAVGTLLTGSYLAAMQVLGADPTPGVVLGLDARRLRAGMISRPTARSIPLTGGSPTNHSTSCLTVTAVENASHAQLPTLLPCCAAAGPKKKKANSVSSGNQMHAVQHQHHLGGQPRERVQDVAVHAGGLHDSLMLPRSVVIELNDEAPVTAS